MDYDSTSIPARYRAARELPASVMQEWLSSVRRSVPLPPGSRIADVGCGTGRFSMGLADAYRLGARVMVDNMLAHDADEGIRAFLEKRKARWQDR